MDNETITKEFREHLIRRSDDLGLTMRAVAARSGISEPSIGNYTCGRAAPGLCNAARIAEALGVSVDWMIGNQRTVRPTFPNFCESGERMCPRCGRVTQVTAELVKRGRKVDVAASWDTQLPPRFCGHCGARFEPMYDYYGEDTDDYGYYTDNDWSMK